MAAFIGSILLLSKLPIGRHVYQPGHRTRAQHWARETEFSGKNWRQDARQRCGKSNWFGVYRGVIQGDWESRRCRRWSQFSTKMSSPTESEWISWLFLGAVGPRQSGSSCLHVPLRFSGHWTRCVWLCSVNYIHFQTAGAIHYLLFCAICHAFYRMQLYHKFVFSVPFQKTIYSSLNFKLFCLIIAYVLGEAMASASWNYNCFLYFILIWTSVFIPTKGWFRYLNPGPFNIKEHAAIVIMASTASNVAIAMEIIAALGEQLLKSFINVCLTLLFNLRSFLWYSSQRSCGHVPNICVPDDRIRWVYLSLPLESIPKQNFSFLGIAGVLRTLLVYPT